MVLTKEELFLPRYKVISSWPFMETNGFSLNMILVLNEVSEDGHHFITQGIVSTYEQFFKDYNTIFKKLNWWEDRKPEEMPEYISYYDTSMYFPVGPYICKTAEAPFNSYNYTADFFQPATKEDYENYIKSKECSQTKN